MHHLVTLYYVAKGVYISGEDMKSNEAKKIIKGWQFIKENCKEHKDGRISFDFSWEPKPTYYRHCNFIDTTTYFYIIDLLRYLELLNLITTE